MHNLQCLTILINVFKSNFGKHCLEKFAVFARLEVSFWPKTEKFKFSSGSSRTKVFELLTYFLQEERRCRAVALHHGGAAHSAAAAAQRRVLPVLASLS